jgi:hypothetical protein
MKGSPIFGAENPMPFIEWPSLTQDERSPDQGSLKYQPGSLRGRVGAIGLALAYLLFGRIVRGRVQLVIFIARAGSLNPPAGMGRESRPARLVPGDRGPS